MNYSDPHRNERSNTPRNLNTKQNSGETNGRSNSVQEGPFPLQRKIPSAAHYPIDALGQLLGTVTRDIQRIVRAPDAICAQSVLAAAAWAVQGHANIEIEGRLNPLSLFFCTVGATGERKTAVDDIALAPHLDYEKKLHYDYSDQQKKWERFKCAWEKSKTQALKGKTLQARQDELAALGELPPKPLQPLLKITEPSYEGIYKLLMGGQPSVGLFTSEGGQFVGGHAMNQDNALKTASGLSSLWDNGCADRVRSGDGASKLYGRRISIHLMLQPIVAEMLLSNRVLAEQGLLSRFLMAWPESTVGNRPYVTENPYSTPGHNAYTQRISEIWDRELPVSEGTLNELLPRRLKLSPEAKRQWIAYHDSVDRDASKGRRFEPIRGPANKAAEQALRIAGVLTLIADIEAREVDLPQLQAGIELAEFYLGEALRINEAGITDPDILLAEKTLQWFKEKPFVYKSEIYQLGPNPISTAASATRIAKILEDHGHWAKVEGGMVLDGRHRRDVWMVVDEY